MLLRTWGVVVLSLMASDAGTPSVSSAERVVVLENDTLGPIADSTSHAVAAIFVRRDCPIANRYAPELRRLHEKFHSQGVSFWLVFPDADETVDSIRAHLDAYASPFGAILDPRHVLVRAAGAQVTPEAALFVSGQLVYRGRIDNTYAALGARRAFATTHDLERAIEAILKNRPPPVARTTAIGCSIVPQP